MMMNEFTSALISAAETLGIALAPGELARYEQYQQLICQVNAQMNLTAITDPQEMAVKHFLDSLSLEMLWQPQVDERVVDIGSGAGFPGVPLAIRYPHLSVLLNDSARKKVNFLQQVIDELQLTNCTAQWSRAEELARLPEMRGQFDVVLARALAHLAVLCEYAMPLLKMGGVLLAMKGPGGQREVQESAQALKLLGAQVAEVRVLQLASAGERQLIMLRKVQQTPDKYPRNSGQARKNPLFLDSRAQET